MYSDKIERVLITKEQIKTKVEELGKQISKDYEGKSLLVLCMLKGASVFFSDLMRELKGDVEIEFIYLSSYKAAARSCGEVTLVKDMESDVDGKNVLVVEDIIDTGLTLTYLKKLLETRGANSVKVCSFLDKPSRRETELEGDFIGYEIPDEFVIGYGLDYAEKFRNLPEICVLKREVYEK